MTREANPSSGKSSPITTLNILIIGRLAGHFDASNSRAPTSPTTCTCRLYMVCIAIFDTFAALNILRPSMYLLRNISLKRKAACRRQIVYAVLNVMPTTFRRRGEIGINCRYSRAHPDFSVIISYLSTPLGVVFAAEMKISNRRLIVIRIFMCS